MIEPEAVAARIEIAPQRRAIGLPEAVFHEICSHALEAVPEECCGLVLGAAGGSGAEGVGRFRRVYRCRNVMDRMHQDDPKAFPRSNHDAFYIDPRELWQAAREAERADEAVTAVYHSHVGARAYFSAMDRAYATQPGFPFPDADHVVVSVLDRQVRELGLFRPGPAGQLAGFPVESLPS